MIKTNLNGECVFLLNDYPNFSKGFTTDFNFFTDQQSSLTRHETRRAYSSTLRTDCKFTVTLSGGSLRAMQGMLRQLKAQPVLLPFWPVVSFWSQRNNMPVQAGLYVAFKADWSQWTIFAPSFTADGSWTADSEIVTADAGTNGIPAWPQPTDYVAPLMYGFLKPKGDISVRSMDVGNISFEFIESSNFNYALVFTAGNLQAGPLPVGYVTAPKIIPFQSDWNAITESLTVTVNRDQVGFRREQPATFYPQDVYRAQKSRYTLKGLSKIIAALNWFQIYGCAGSSFWVPSALANGYLVSTATGATADGSWTADSESITADETAQSITLADVLAFEVNDYISTFDSSGNLFWSQVVNVGANNTLNLASPFGVKLTIGQRFYYLALARLNKGKVSVTWKSPMLAQFAIDWTEVRTEEFLPQDETLGVTIGQLNTRVVLFNFWRDYGNGSIQHWYYTSFERNFAYQGNNYVPGSFEMSDNSVSVNMENDSCDFSFSLVNFDGTLDTSNPLLLDVILGAEAPMEVQILFADLVNGQLQNVTPQFEGEVASFSRKGNSVKASCKFGTSIFESELPLLVKGLTCPHLHGSPGDGSHLISQGCTGPDQVMKRANWQFSALVANPVSAAFPYTVQVTALNGVGIAAQAAITTPQAVFQNFFSFGWIELGQGNNVQRRMIVGSTVPVVNGLGQLTCTLTLHRYFSSAPVAGATVNIYPGCDGNFTTCQPFDAVNNPTGKFGNNLNFGGDPFTPIANPTLATQPTNNLNGSKK